MPSIFSIGLSALSAAQAAQATTGHNIANATTDGYNRQIVKTSTNGAVYYGYGYIGMGVQVTGIDRAYDDLLAKQVLTAKTASSYYTEYSQKISQLDDVVADSDAGFTTSLQSFFDSIQDLSSYPNSDASRQGVLSNGQSLVDKFASLNKILEQEYNTVNGQVRSAVTSLNSYATKIAELNEGIIKAQANGSAANDMLDQRDQLVTELNDLVKVTVTKESNGSYSIYMGSGQPLVMGTAKATISAEQSLDDPTRLELAYTFKNGEKSYIPGKLLEGGSVGAALDYRTNTLDVARNSLGRIAVVLASSFNDVQTAGQDQDGEQGKAFFSIGDPVVSPRSTNSANADLQVSITDPSALTTSDYRVSYNGTAYSIMRLSDRTSQTYADTDFPVTLDGVEYQLPTNMVKGDVFTVKPTANGAATIGTLLTNTRQIAAALPVVASTQATDDMNLDIASNAGNGAVTNFSIDHNTFATGSTFDFTYNGGNLTLNPPGDVTVTTRDGQTLNYASGTAIPYSEGGTITTGGISFTLSGIPQDGDHYAFSPETANTGTGSISDIKVDKSYYDNPLTAGSDLEFTYDRTANTFTPSANVGAVSVTHLDGTTTDYAAGDPITYKEGDVYTTDNGISFTIKGQPYTGDKFKVSLNTDGVGDNRNAVNMAALQTATTIEKTTYQGAYSSFVSVIGNQANEVKVLGAAQDARKQSLVDQQQSISGVNQDEELANMIQNQYAYQGAAKVIQAASDMLDVILNIQS